MSRPAPQAPLTSDPDQLPPALTTARSLLLALVEHQLDPLDRLAAGAALARLDDVLPPHPPAQAAPSELRGSALVEAASDALIALLREVDDAPARGRALLALEELHPLPLELDAPGALGTPGAPAAPARRG